MLVDCSAAAFMTATDADIMRERLNERLKERLGQSFSLIELVVPRVFARADGGYSILYSAKATGYDLIPSGRMFFGGRLLEADRELHPFTSGEDEKIIYFDDLRLAVPIFPYDPRLVHLRKFLSKEKAQEILAPAVSKLHPGLDFKSESIEILGYRLERRCVLRYGLKTISRRCGLSINFQLIAKILRPGSSSEIAGRLDFLAANDFLREAPDRLTIPQLLSVDSQHDALLMESVPGNSLHDLLDHADFPEGCYRAGKMLKKLHSVPLGKCAHYSSSDELAALSVKLKSASKLFASLRAEFDRIYGLLSQSVPDNDNHNKSNIHRDFYDKQIILDKERATLLDCDNLAIGDPALDYGNFLAHLILRQKEDPRNAAGIALGRQRFVAAYDAPDGRIAARADWWQATALARLAALYILRPRWRQMAPELIRESERILKESHS